MVGTTLNWRCCKCCSPNYPAKQAMCSICKHIYCHKCLTLSRSPFLPLHESHLRHSVTNRKKDDSKLTEDMERHVDVLETGKQSEQRDDEDDRHR